MSLLVTLQAHDTIAKAT